MCSADNRKSLIESLRLKHDSCAKIHQEQFSLPINNSIFRFEIPIDYIMHVQILYGQDEATYIVSGHFQGDFLCFSDQIKEIFAGYVFHEDIEVNFILECLHKADNIRKYGLLEDCSFICHEVFQFSLSDLLFRHHLQSIKMVAILAILHKQNLAELSLPYFPNKGKLFQIELMAIKSQFLMQFVLENEHASMVVKLFEEFLHSLERQEATIAISIFYQLTTTICLIHPIVFIEYYSLIFIIYSPFQTYHKAFVQAFIQNTTILHEKGLEFYDSFMYLVSCKRLEDGGAHECPSFKIIEDKIVNGRPQCQLNVSPANDGASSSLDCPCRTLSSVVIGKCSLPKDFSFFEQDVSFMRNRYLDNPLRNDVNHLYVIILLKDYLARLINGQFDGMSNGKFLFVGQTTKQRDFVDSSNPFLLLFKFHFLQCSFVKIWFHHQKDTVFFANNGSCPWASEKQGQFSKCLPCPKSPGCFIINNHFHQSSLDEEKAITDISLLKYCSSSFSISHQHLTGNRIYFLLIQRREQLMMDESFRCELQLLLGWWISRDGDVLRDNISQLCIALEQVVSLDIRGRFDWI